MKVTEAMTTPVKSCSADTSLEDIARMMWNEDCGAIPVVSDDNRPIGIVTDRDIAMCAMHRHAPLWEINAAHVIQGQNLVCCNQGDEIDDCVEKMEQARVRRILVTNDQGALCGIVSMGDAVAFTERDTGHDEIAAVEPEQLLDMLHAVSAHHETDARPLLRPQVTQGY